MRQFFNVFSCSHHFSFYSYFYLSAQLLFPYYSLPNLKYHLPVDWICRLKFFVPCSIFYYRAERFYLCVLYQQLPHLINHLYPSLVIKNRNDSFTKTSSVNFIRFSYTSLAVLSAAIFKRISTVRSPIPII